MRVNKMKVLVVGDLIVDKFIYGDVGRISPESPNLILDYRNEEVIAGGAYNVCAHLRSLNVECDFISLSGSDLYSHLDKGDFAEDRNKIVLSTRRSAIIKTRLIARYKSTTLLRLDREDSSDLNETEERSVLDALKSLSEHKYSVICLSDYKKGLLTSGVITEIKNFSKKNQSIVIVDTKASNLDLYHGVQILKPNQLELDKIKQQIGIEFQSNEVAARKIWEKYRIPKLFLTLGHEGVECYDKGSLVLKLPAVECLPRELSGAGDSSLACLTYSLMNGGDWLEGAQLAVKGAAKFISEKATYRLQELDLRGNVVE